LQGEKLAAEYGVQFFETSAKADLNVETAFEGIAREVPGASLVIAGLGE
jgi:Ras-related protein Rab-8A